MSMYQRFQVPLAAKFDFDVVSSSLWEAQKNSELTCLILVGAQRC